MQRCRSQGPVCIQTSYRGFVICVGILRWFPRPVSLKLNFPFLLLCPISLQRGGVAYVCIRKPGQIKSYRGPATLVGSWIESAFVCMCVCASVCEWWDVIRAQCSISQLCVCECLCEIGVSFHTENHWVCMHWTADAIASTNNGSQWIPFSNRIPCCGSAIQYPDRKKNQNQKSEIERNDGYLNFLLQLRQDLGTTREKCQSNSWGQRAVDPLPARATLRAGAVWTRLHKDREGNWASWSLVTKLTRIRRKKLLCFCSLSNNLSLRVLFVQSLDEFTTLRTRGITITLMIARGVAQRVCLPR